MTSLLLLTTTVPLGTGAPTCESLTRTVGTVEAHTESCTDVYTSPSYNYTRYWNATSIEQQDPSGARVVATTWSSHEIYEPIGARYEYRNHAYNVNYYDASGALVRSANVGMADSQSRHPWGCNEYAAVGGWFDTRVTYTSAFQQVAMNDDPSYPLPCTSPDVQDALP